MRRPTEARPKASRSFVTLGRLMTEFSSQAVETGTLEESSAADVPASVRAQSLWPRRESRGWQYAVLRRMLALADVAAALLASLLVAGVGSVEAAQLTWSLAFLPAWIAVAKVLGLYDRDQRSLRHLTVDEAPQIVLWAFLGTAFLSLFLELVPAGRLDAGSAVSVGAVAGLSAFVLRAFTRWLWRAVTPPERTLIVGAAASAQAVRRKLELFPDLHMTVVAEREVLGAESNDRDRLRAIDRLVFVPSTFVEEEARGVMELARATGVMLSIVPPWHSIFGSAVQLNHLAELPLLEYRTGHISRSTLFLKRIVDVALSALACVVLLPAFLVVPLAIKLDSRGPVFFRQERVGRGGARFTILKFRTMVADAEAHLADVAHLNRHASMDPRMFKAVNDPRVTSVGRLLRRFSLDELPQLINVLRGEMSLVGPRPLVPEEDRSVTGWATLRSSVPPGITGMWQVHGASRLTFSEMIRLDYEYVSDLSLRRDFQLMMRTLPVLFGRGTA